MKTLGNFIEKTGSSFLSLKIKTSNVILITFLCVFVLSTDGNADHTLYRITSLDLSNVVSSFDPENPVKNISLYPLSMLKDIWPENKADSYKLRFAADEEFPWEIFYPAILNRKETGGFESIPFNQFNIGDSIGEGVAAGGNIDVINHGIVWSTGYDPDDIVYSLNERFEDTDPESYTENNITRDMVFNKAVYGSVMADFVTQAYEVVEEAKATGGAGMVTVLLGNNDACSGDLNGMTDPELFETQFRSGLDVLANSDETKNAEIHVSGIPAIYWLWVAKKSSSTCQLVWWLGEICQVLLLNPEDDCESISSRNDPGNDYPGDGDNCLRRKAFYRKIRDEYNTALRDVVDEYKAAGKLPNVYYVDIYNVTFDSLHVNDGDCFHPSTAGHKLLADEEWSRSKWSTE